MHFNLDQNKQSNEVIFFRISDTLLLHTALTFNSDDFTKSSKTFRNCLKFKIRFLHHIQQGMKYNNITGFIRRIVTSLPRQSSPTISRSFAKAHLDYGYILYKTKKRISKSKLKKVQC